jgi:hypothetical protein
MAESGLLAFLRASASSHARSNVEWLGAQEWNLAAAGLNLKS